MMSGSFGKIACLCSCSTDKPTLGPLCWQEGSGGLISLGVLIGVPALKLNEDSALLSPVRRRECCSKPLQCTWEELTWTLSHDGWNSLFNGAYWAIQEDGVLFLNLSRYAGVCFQKFILPPCSNSWSTKPTRVWPQVDEGEAVRPWVPSWTDCSEGQCIWVRKET